MARPATPIANNGSESDNSEEPPALEHGPSHPNSQHGSQDLQFGSNTDSSEELPTAEPHQFNPTIPFVAQGLRYSTPRYQEIFERILTLNSRNHDQEMARIERAIMRPDERFLTAPTTPETSRRTTEGRTDREQEPVPHYQECIQELRRILPKRISGREMKGSITYFSKILKVAVQFNLTDLDIHMLLRVRSKPNSEFRQQLQISIDSGACWQQTFLNLIKEFPDRTYKNGNKGYNTALQEYNDYEGYATPSGLLTASTLQLLLHTHDLARCLTTSAKDPHAYRSIYIRTRDKVLSLIPMLANSALKTEFKARDQGDDPLLKFYGHILDHAKEIDRFMSYTLE